MAAARCPLQSIEILCGSPRPARRRVWTDCKPYANRCFQTRKFCPSASRDVGWNVQIVGYISVLYIYINWATFIGLLVMILAMPVQGKILKRLFKLNRTMVKDTDERVKITNECLQGIHCIKMYAWEKSFIKVIAKLREQELTKLRSIAYLRAFSRAYMSAVPAVTAAVSLSVYAAAGGVIQASTLFGAIGVQPASLPTFFLSNDPSTVRSGKGEFEPHFRIPLNGRGH